ncbi:7TM-DISM domain-containing protein [Noviherbaspirillum sp.]|uniref:7TM-DISM domain-containing protein n=1 Tax=Noviherbaspirillum sp. TaxID=1926288 RepID=UPI002B45FADA|nr:7TM-DISM domain-containing protein [Noviherbaspirillum sp.]HJV79519.1 7TM-DISM domain-containing protein [Noviherbaspirillum sp.]
MRESTLHLRDAWTAARRLSCSRCRSLLVGSIVFILRQFGILPSAFLIDYGMQIGSALEVILLSLALVQRIRMLKDENVRIQKEATTHVSMRCWRRNGNPRATGAG